jgi:hypothetical protein
MTPWSLRSWRFVTAYRVFTLLPLVAIAVLLGVAFDWRFPVGFGGLLLLFVIAKRYEGKRFDPRRAAPGRGYTTAKVIVFAAVGATVGAFAFGGLGFGMGVLLGLTVGLPLPSVKNERGDLATWDPTNDAQTAAVSRTFGLFIAGMLSLLTVALVIIAIVGGVSH